MWTILQLPEGRTRSFRLFVLWSRTYQVLCFYPIKKTGSSARLEKPRILVANHTSYLDIFLMFAHFPERPFLFLGKSEILSYPIIRTYFKNLNIPVDRSSRSKSAISFRKALQALDEGFSLIIFPEGGIPEGKPPKLARFKDGAFQMAQRSGVEVLPVCILNHYDLFSDPLHPLGPARPGVSHLHVFDPIPVTDSVIDVRKKCQELIENKLNEARKKA